jgi:hypothetical protein
VVVIRQLKRQGLGTADIDLADEEISEEHVIKEDTSFVSRLNHIVQLTGYSDPIYSEAFVNIHKYDITFEVWNSLLRDRCCSSTVVRKWCRTCRLSFAPEETQRYLRRLKE